MSLGQFRASAAARSMSPGSTTAGTTGGRTLTGTFRTGEDRLRSTNAVTEPRGAPKIGIGETRPKLKDSLCIP